MSKKSAYPPGFEVFDELPPPDPEHLALLLAVPLRVVVEGGVARLVAANGQPLALPLPAEDAVELQEIADAVNRKAEVAEWLTPPRGEK
jgi:hypothetical protein